MQYVSIIWFILALGVCFLSSWVVIPAPTMDLLPLGVGAPEVSLLLLLGNIGILAVGYGLASYMAPMPLVTGPFFTGPLAMGPWGRIAIGCGLLGVILSSLPVLQLSATIDQAEQNMQQGLGPNYASHISLERVQNMRSRPFIPIDLMRGIPFPNIQPERQSFQTPDGTTLALEIYRPSHALNTSSTPTPVLVTIYGGAWQTGEPERTKNFSTYMAAQGYGVVAIDYRHAPEYQFPTQLEDVWTALRWVGDHAENYGFDRQRIAVVGWSAGGHLAMLSAYRDLPETLKGISIQAVVNYYGPVDLAAGYRDPLVPDPIDNRVVLEAFLGGTPDELPQEYADASPSTYVRSGLPPTLLIYGDRDHLVKPIFGYQLHDQLQALNNQSVLLRLPWAEHAFDAIFSGMGNQIALYHTERFLAWALLKPDDSPKSQA